MPRYTLPDFISEIVWTSFSVMDERSSGNFSTTSLFACGQGAYYYYSEHINHTERKKQHQELMGCLRPLRSPSKRVQRLLRPRRI